MTIPEVKKQKQEIIDFLHSTYKLDKEYLNSVEFSQFLDTSLYTILSLKIWIQKIREHGSVYPIHNEIYHYLQEVISDLNNALLLGALGFRSASFLFIRRGLENLLKYLYYKDHIIEFYQVKSGSITPPSNNDLKKYFLRYPKELLTKYHGFSEEDVDTVYDIIKKLLDPMYSRLYKKTSKYIHGERAEHLELRQYLDEIVPDVRFISELHKAISEFSLITQVFLLIFYRQIYVTLRGKKRQ